MQSSIFGSLSVVVVLLALSGCGDVIPPSHVGRDAPEAADIHLSRDRDLHAVTEVRPADRGEVGWVGLHNRALIDWLENENRLHDLCSHARDDDAQSRACRDEHMSPKEYVVQLRSAPEESASSEGSLAIVAMPGRGLRAYYRPANAESAAEFVPDLFDSDWGYGPYFHQTFLERRNTWFLLPAHPFPGPVWANLAEFTNEPDVRLLRTGEIITTPRGDLIVLGLQSDVLMARPEQEADMWCESGDPPAVQPETEVRIPVSELYGSTGHLLVSIKYTRGC